MTTHRPFVYITGFYSLGIILDHFTRVPFGYVCLCVFAFLIAGAWISNRTFVPMIFLLLAVTGLGMAYTQSRQNTGKDYIAHVAKYYRKKPLAVKGVIVSAVTERRSAIGPKTTFTLDVRGIKAKWGWQKKTGRLLVNVFRDPDVDYGDHVMLEGRLHRPYNFSAERNFSYRKYLSRRGIDYILSVKKNGDIRIIGQNRGNYFKALSLHLREKFKNVLSRHLSRNEAEIMGAVLLGDRSGIPKPVRTLFVQTGTAHILAISGLHIGVVAAIFMIFMKFVPIGRKWRLGSVIVLLMCYAFFTGGRPSVVRASVMMAVFLASFIIEKEPDIINTFCLAAMVILVMNPLNLFDVGFQLSFICVFSIIYLNMKLKEKKSAHPPGRGMRRGTGKDDRWRRPILKTLILSLAIWVGVAGLVAYYFGIVTPVTILANLMIVPLISIIVTLGFGLLIFGIALPSGAFMFSACLKVALNVMVGLIYLCTKIPFAYIYVRDVRSGHVVMYYTVLALTVFVPWGRLWSKLKARPVK